MAKAVNDSHTSGVLAGKRDSSSLGKRRIKAILQSIMERLILPHTTNTISNRMFGDVTYETKFNLPGKARLLYTQQTSEQLQTTRTAAAGANFDNTTYSAVRYAYHKLNMIRFEV